MTYTETAITRSIERLAGTTLSALDQRQLDAVDQFHVGGAEAVDRLIPALRLTSGMTALDVGSGFGGPARQVARVTGGNVVGVDLAASYVAAARRCR
jgi:sarcosine/dimethylglycine N-methyltransferase